MEKLAAVRRAEVSCYDKLMCSPQIHSTGKRFMRAMPMWVAAIAGGILGGFLDSAAWALLLLLSVKFTLDVFGHFAQHGMLTFDEDPS